MALMLGFKAGIGMSNLSVRTRRIYPTDDRDLKPTAELDTGDADTTDAVEQIVRTGQGQESRVEYEHLVVDVQLFTEIQQWHADNYDPDDPATPPVFLDGSIIAHNLTGEQREPPAELTSAYEDLVQLREQEFSREGLVADVEAVKPPAVIEYDDAIQWAEETFLTRREAEAWYLTEERGLDQRVAGACLGVSRSTIYSHLASTREKFLRMRDTRRFFDKFGRPEKRGQ